MGFFAWDKFPRRKLPRKTIPDLAPDLAVEVLSESSTHRGMEQKLKDYFFAGVRVVWYIDARKKTVQVFSSSAASRLLHERDTLDGGDVLPGLRLPLRELFAEVPEMEEETPPPD
jgi:Uma2 family endonuclease